MTKVIDLRKFNCPETFLYAKLGLEEIKDNLEVEILLKSKDDCKNVSQSLLNEGYKNVSLVFDEENDQYKIKITN